VRAPGFVIAATGLAAEARIAARVDRVVAFCAGGDAARLASLIEEQLARGASGIISFGIAGGLRPDLSSGQCIVATSVMDGERTYAADAAWTNALAARLPSAVRGVIAGCPAIIADPAAKKALFDKTTALAADMESHVVARTATEHKLPFAVLRVVADTAAQRLPPAALCGLKPDGTPDIAAVLKAVGSAPGQIPDLIRTAVAARRAMTGLLRCHRLLGPGFGLADLG
jgi:hopanoid-associated phosphorylase